MQIFIVKNGQREGPFPVDQIQAQVAAGVLKPTDLAWHKGLADWVPLAQILNSQSPGSSSQPARPLLVNVICAYYFISTPLGLFSLFLLPLILVGYAHHSEITTTAARPAPLIGYTVALAGVLGVIKLAGAVLLFRMRRAALLVFGVVVLYDAASYVHLILFTPWLSHVFSSYGGAVSSALALAFFAINVAVFVYVFRLNKAGALR